MEKHRRYRYTLTMEEKEKAPKTHITTRIIRPGETVPTDDEMLNLSIEERIDAVWELTKLCYAWQTEGLDEPRLQRSISHIQRPKR